MKLPVNKNLNNANERRPEIIAFPIVENKNSGTKVNVHIKNLLIFNNRILVIKKYKKNTKNAIVIEIVAPLEPLSYITNTE